MPHDQCPRAHPSDLIFSVPCKVGLHHDLPPEPHATSPGIHWTVRWTPRRATTSAGREVPEGANSVGRNRPGGSTTGTCAPGVHRGVVLDWCHTVTSGSPVHVMVIETTARKSVHRIPKPGGLRASRSDCRTSTEGSPPCGDGLGSVVSFTGLHFLNYDEPKHQPASTSGFAAAYVH